MKILAVTYSGTISGGANRSLLMVLKNLKNIYNHEVYVILPSKGNFADALDEAGIKWKMFPFYSSCSPKIKSPADMMKYVLTAVRDIINKKKAYRLAHELKGENFDVVYSTEIVRFFGAYLAEALEIPHVWHFRNAAEQLIFKPSTSKMLQNMNGKIITISYYLQNYVCMRFGLTKDKVIMIHNGLDLGFVVPSSQDRSNGFHMVLCARFVPEKGHMEALKALHILKNKGYEKIYLHFAGSIPSYGKNIYFDSVKKYIENNMLKDNVIFDGEINNMSAYREKMNVELMCSTAEAFGRVTVEGMRSGLVVIGSNTGGTIDIIKDRYNGFLYEQGNARDLADKILYVYNNPKKAKEIAERAIKFSETHFLMEENVAKIERVLRECANQ